MLSGKGTFPLRSRSGEIGRRPGLKIPWDENPVPVRARFPAPYIAGWSSLVARWAHNPKVVWFKSRPRNHIVKPKKDIMASNPRNLTISGVFLAFARFFATMRFADTECRKKDIISKKRLPAGC